MNETFDGGIPGSISSLGGSALSSVSGKGGQALGAGVANAGRTSGFIWNAAGVLVPGKTYAMSVQAKSLGTPDPIHVEFIGRDNSNWNGTGNFGWVYANVNNNPATGSVGPATDSCTCTCTCRNSGLGQQPAAG